VAKRFFEPLRCWSYLDGRRPAIPVTLSTLDGKRIIHEEQTPLDTGFAGAMLLSREMFGHFEKAELPESESRIYRTLIGPIPMLTARALLKFPVGDEFEILLDTPKYGMGTSLIGLQLLTRVELLLSGSKTEACILREISRA